MSNCINQYLYVPRSFLIVEIEELTNKENRYVLVPEDGRPIGRGEFVAVYGPGIGEAPISLISSPSVTDRIEIAVRRIDPPEGRHDNVYVQTLMNVSTYIHSRKVGDAIGIRGPFGKEFPVHDLKGKNIAFVPGGIGLFPVCRPAREIAEDRDAFGKVWVLFGGNTIEERYFPRLLDEWKASKTFDVREGYWNNSAGYDGPRQSAIDLLPAAIQDADPKDTVAYIVGPSPMFFPAVRTLKTYGVPRENIYFSLERQMRCCVGRCGHCHINDELVCVDGPVFTLAEIVERNLWEALINPNDPKAKEKWAEVVNWEAQ